MKQVVLGPGEGEHLQLIRSSAVIKAGIETTDGRFALAETTLEPGFEGPRPHLHRETIDMFFVLEGTLTMQLDEETLELSAGSFVLVPPVTKHTFSNPTAQRVRLLNMDVPAGLESYLREMASAMADDPIDRALVTEIASRYDIAAAE